MPLRSVCRSDAVLIESVFMHARRISQLRVFFRGGGDTAVHIFIEMC